MNLLPSSPKTGRISASGASRDVEFISRVHFYFKLRPTANDAEIRERRSGDSRIVGGIRGSKRAQRQTAETIETSSRKELARQFGFEGGAESSNPAFQPIRRRYSCL